MRTFHFSLQQPTRNRKRVLGATMPDISTSEIDDIFGSSSGSKNAQKRVMKSTIALSTTSPISTPLSNQTSKKKKQKKKIKSISADAVPVNVPSSVVPPTASTTEETPFNKSKTKKKIKLTSSEEVVQGDSSNTHTNPSSSIQSNVLLGDTSTSTSTTTQKKRAAPETVLDPSALIESKASALASSTSKKRRVGYNGGTVGAVSGSEETPYVRRDNNNSDEERFRDSRGTGPSAFHTFYLPVIKRNIDRDATLLGRRTEEGYLIYKEDELGIQQDGGGERLEFFLLYTGVISYFSVVVALMFHTY